MLSQVSESFTFRTQLCDEMGPNKYALRKATAAMFFLRMESSECCGHAPQGLKRRGSAFCHWAKSACLTFLLGLVLLVPAPGSAQDSTAQTAESSAAADATSMGGPGGAALPATQSTPSATEKKADGPERRWNLHVQNTDIVQGYPPFSARYSGPDSLPSAGEARETVSLDLMAGFRLGERSGGSTWTASCGRDSA